MSDLTSNNDPDLRNPYPDDEIDLKELLMVLWSGKWLISAITGLAAAISVAVALSLPNIYTASALLAPAESSGGGLSGLMKQYGGLASLAGVSLPGGVEEVSRTQVGLQLMQSRTFIGGFVQQRQILPELFATKSWDASSGSIVLDPDVYDAESQRWFPGAEPEGSPQPSIQMAHKAFLAILNVTEDQKTGFVTVSIEHKSPELAAKWVNWLIEDVNRAVKEQDVLEAERSIEYLKQQVASTSLADLQMVFFELIQSQTQTMMMAEVRPEYVFKTIDPAVSPEQKSKPKRALICILGTMLGAVLSIFLTLGHHYHELKTLRSQSG